MMAIDLALFGIGQGFGGLIEFIESVKCVDVLWNWESPNTWDQDRF